jgi:hypothetical protein
MASSTPPMDSFCNQIAILYGLYMSKTMMTSDNIFEPFDEVMD